MRLLSKLLMTGSVGALGFASGALGLTYLAPPPKPFHAPERAAAVASAQTDIPVPSPVWPAVFGTVVIPEPAPLPEPTPEPEPVAQVEAPPEENTSYILTGLVAGGQDSWAMVAENDTSVVVRRGDTLVGGETVTAIDARGVWIDWNGESQLIPVQKSDLTGLVRVQPANPVQTTPSDTSEISLQVERLNQRFIEAAFFEAGRLAGAQLADGTSGLEVVSIRQGEFYDQIGLKTGDTIVRINGKAVVTLDLPTETPGEVLENGSLDLEFLRNGARQRIRVNLDQI